MRLCVYYIQIRTEGVLQSVNMAALDKLLPLLETYKGRDRFLRLLSYMTKCAAGVVESPKIASQFDNFSKQLSTSRACFRLLDDIPTIAGIIKSRGNEEDSSAVQKFVTKIENVVDIIFSPLDHISWAIEHKIINYNGTFWDTASVWCWVISLYINIYKILRRLSDLSQKRMETPQKERALRSNLSVKHWYLEMSALKCVIDLLFAVNYLPRGLLWAKLLSKSQVGALGSLSSIISLYQVLML